MENEGPLVEMTNIKQTEKGIFRRFFIDGDNDLTVWYDDDKRLVGFQLSIFDIAITYDRGKKRINRIDSCEKDNFAPLITEEADIDIAEVVEYLRRNDQNIEKELAEYIFKALGVE
jgi:hypothetical protein